MKECVNGIRIDMTAEEIAEIEKLREEVESTLPIPTTEERIQAIEEQLSELKETLE